MVDDCGKGKRVPGRLESDGLGGVHLLRKRKEKSLALALALTLTLALAKGRRFRDRIYDFPVDPDDYPRGNVTVSPRISTQRRWQITVKR